MKLYIFQLLSIVVLGSTLACSTVKSSATSSPVASAPVIVAAEPASIAKGNQTAIFAGGCFWGLEAVFESIKGVSDVKSGYSGGAAQTANYDAVSEGTTGHAEAVEITFDPSVVSYKQLLEVFFAVAHDPTELNRQGPDTGSQYRSEIFFTTDAQKKEAEAYIAELAEKKTYSKPIVTVVAPLEKFYDAEEHHQDYLRHHPDQGYIVVNDKPKVENLEKQFPALYVKK